MAICSLSGPASSFFFSGGFLAAAGSAFFFTGSFPFSSFFVPSPIAAAAIPFSTLSVEAAAAAPSSSSSFFFSASSSSSGTTNPSLENFASFFLLMIVRSSTTLHMLSTFHFLFLSNSSSFSCRLAFAFRSSDNSASSPSRSSRSSSSESSSSTSPSMPDSVFSISLIRKLAASISLWMRFLSTSSLSSLSTRERCFIRNHDSRSMLGWTSSSSSESSMLSHLE
mmetsp:Transcript_62355/g.184516  ORF Transcript_62355/g.184516 Transcript_62355/m.184516 type:complete len:224 (-) Transcript_62355:215-886(-)